MRIHDTDETKRLFLSQRNQAKGEPDEETTRIFEDAFEKLTAEDAEDRDFLLPPEIMAAKLEKEAAEKIRVLHNEAERGGLLLPTHFNKSIETVQPGAEEVLLTPGY